MTKLIRPSPGKQELTLRTDAIMKRKGFYGTARILGNNIANSASNVEQDSGNESISASKAPAFDSLVDIKFVQYRTRLTDSDNPSGKAAIDGLVHAAIIEDDGPQQVRETRHWQVKVKNKEDEKTVIQIRRISE